VRAVLDALLAQWTGFWRWVVGMRLKIEMKMVINIALIIYN
jgi:hypothetical protein